MLKSLKKNQIIIYVIALMLVAAGYLNYTADGKGLLQASADPEVTYKENVADIGDAALVSSNDVAANNTDVNNAAVQSAEDANTSAENAVTAQNTQETAATDGQAVSTDEYFSKSKLERDTMYSQMLETYQNIVNSSTVSEEQKNIAAQEITNINNVKNSIMICENLLSTKGFENNVVFVNGTSVSVVVKTNGELAANQVAQIQNVISREMNVDVQNINITQKGA